MKIYSDFSKKFLLIFLILFSFIQFSCEESISISEIVQNNIYGSVSDEQGRPVSDVKIFKKISQVPLYSLNQGSIPLRLEKFTTRFVLDFNFELFQNIPNPFSHSTAIRFSIPENCSAEISIYNLNSNEKIYSQNMDLLYGLYQIYLEDIVNNLQMANDFYRYEFSAVGSDSVYHAQKCLCVQNLDFLESENYMAITKDNGTFIFETNELYPDSSLILVNERGEKESELNVQELIALVFAKEGYQILTIPFNRGDISPLQSIVLHID